MEQRNQANISSWVEPKEISNAKLDEVHTQPPQVTIEQPRKEKPEPTRVEPEQSGGSGLDLSMIMGLLGGLGGGNPQMDMVMKLLGNKQKGGGFDIMSMLPLLMNSGLFTPKSSPRVDEGRMINLADYRRID
jgi:hypothetical protein